MQGRPARREDGSCQILSVFPLPKPSRRGAERWSQRLTEQSLPKCFSPENSTESGSRSPWQLQFRYEAGAMQIHFIALPLLSFPVYLTALLPFENEALCHAQPLRHPKARGSCAHAHLEHQLLHQSLASVAGGDEKLGDKVLSASPSSSPVRCWGRPQPDTSRRHLLSCSPEKTSILSWASIFWLSCRLRCH